MVPSAQRLVSLVPSVTDTVAALGGGERLVGVTRYCVAGAPASARRVGGTKNPDLDAIVALRPDLVLANAEENRLEDIAALEDRGVDVLVTTPERVADVPAMVGAIADRLALGGPADALCRAVSEAAAEAAAAAPAHRLRVLALVWRKPWMALGEGTYAGDLLRVCGFDNVLEGCGARYPRLAVAPPGRVDVALLPSEPYRFGEPDLPAVRELLGTVRCELVDGELLTWHGARTPAGLRAFVALARQLAAEAG